MPRRASRKYGAGPDYKKICLIAPMQPESFWSMKGTAKALGAKTLQPNAALATLMALTPDDVNVEYVLFDENVGPIDRAVICDLVALTGSSLQAEKVHDLCAHFRSRGIPVALGGTYASIEPERCAGIADFHFIGEAEYTWPLFLRQWTRGRARAVYEQKEHISMQDSPAPDWSLIRVDDYVNIPIQTSRGCPNRCDFCDVIHYVGRKYRVKSVDQVMAEVRRAHEIGARTIFFSDDNFYGNRAYTNELMRRLVQWNVSQERPLSFSTQITVQIADDDGLLKLFADAKFSVLFIGVESVRRESLEEIHKTQNLARDIRERIMNISRYGLVPFVGLIVGFDHDDESVFGELFGFLHETATPVAGVSLLNAPRRTPLYARLKQAGRIIEYDGDWQLATNIVPLNMTREDLERRYWDLFRKIYEPAVFEQRLEAWLRGIDYFTGLYTNRKFDWKLARSGYRMFKYFVLQSPSELRAVFFHVLKKAWSINPRLVKRVFTTMAQYAHFYDFVKNRSGTRGC
ncbi:MAG TPA: DUF4070 domain-containing protein [Spirochaetota bacterium]|nr:DUF4070 domain-containing protein [Spirochaetota bacterium]HPI88874.1 DUF4070 domain-containing protein [Spirochaetota bacterium]HPR46996.1 DUF4070 domain-containing protein [Spirochaetota bacterium]